MKLSRMLLALAFATLLAACQTTGGPTPSTAALLERQGFQAGSPADLNKNLAPDDLISTAYYECKTSQCGESTVVIYANDPKPIDIYNEISQLENVSPARARRLAAKAFKEAGAGAMKLNGASVFNAANGVKGIVIDASLREDGVTIYLRITGLYTRDSGRAVVAASPIRAMTMRFASRQMLE